MSGWPGRGLAFARRHLLRRPFGRLLPGAGSADEARRALVALARYHFPT
jgi:hypothetical protein